MNECYHVVSEENLFDLEREVNRLLGEGWSLVGGLCWSSFHIEQKHFKQDAPTFHQAMNKTSK